MDTRVLVTGAGGFIGSHLVDALVRSGARVRAMVRYNGRGDLGALRFSAPEVASQIEIVRGDVTDAYFTRACVDGCATVFHLAALVAIPYSYDAPRNVFDVNVLGSMNVAQACLATGAAMVHTSTSEVYGTAQTVPITESHPLSAQSPYAASKIGADQGVLSFHRSFGLRAVLVRPFNTYGPRQSARAVIPAIISQALAGPTVRLGSLHPTRDLLFVDDTVRGFVAAAERIDRIAGDVIQLGTGADVSIGALAQRIFAVMGVSREIVSEQVRVRPAASEVARLVADPTRARERLGWSSRVALDDGLKNAVEFVRAHRELYRVEEYAR